MAPSDVLRRGSVSVLAVLLSSAGPAVADAGVSAGVPGFFDTTTHRFEPSGEKAPGNAHLYQGTIRVQLIVYADPVYETILCRYHAEFGFIVDDENGAHFEPDTPWNTKDASVQLFDPPPPDGKDPTIPYVYASPTRPQIRLVLECRAVDDGGAEHSVKWATEPAGLKRQPGADVDYTFKVELNL